MERKPNKIPEDNPQDSSCSPCESLDTMVLKHLIEPPACRGSVRKATLGDLDLIVDWKCAAIREAVGEEPIPARVRETTLGQLERGMVWLMESPAGEPVSMANCSQAGQGLLSTGGTAAARTQWPPSAGMYWPKGTSLSPCLWIGGTLSPTGYTGSWGL